MMHAANVLLALPFGPCSRSRRLARPSRTKLRERAVERLLDRLVADQEVAGAQALFALELQVEQLEPRELAPRALHLVGAVEVEAVVQVARCVARVPIRMLRELVQVLAEREHALLGVEALPDPCPDALELQLQVGHALILHLQGETGAPLFGYAQRSCGADFRRSLHLERDGHGALIGHAGFLGAHGEIDRGQQLVGARLGREPQVEAGALLADLGGVALAQAKPW